MKRTETATIISALRVLAVDIQSEDGVANSAIAEAADRMEELADAGGVLHKLLEKSQVDCVPSDSKLCRINYKALVLYDWMTK